MTKVLYYWEDYYLVPDGYASPEEFLSSEAIKSEVTLSKLNEKGCIAPYFIREEITQETLLIDEPGEVCLVDAQILSREEYLSRLASTACEYCKSCKKFREDTSLLADELTLDGMCYEDEDEIRDQFKDKVDDFWAYFMEREARILSLLDEDASGAEDLLLPRLSFLPGTYLSLRKIKDRYYFMASALYDQYLSLLLEYLVSRAPESLKERWELYWYLPQNMFKYTPSKETVNVYLNAPLIRFQKKKADRPRYDVTLKIFPHKDPEVDLLRENLLYVFSVMGENRFYAALSSLNCDMEYEKDRDSFVHIKDYSVEIQKEYMQNLRMYFRRFHYGEFPLKKGQCAMRGKDDQLVTTNCDNLTQALISNRRELLKTTFPSADYIGTLTLDFGCTIKEYSPLLRAIHDQIEQAVYTPGYIIPFATCYGTNKVYVDFILADINKARKAIRALTPLLARYHVTYTETTAQGSNTYKADYELGIHEA